MRSAISGDLIRSWAVPQEFVSKCLLIRWFGGTSSGDSDKNNHSRLLLCDPQAVRIFDVQDGSWKASIDGATGNVGQISNVCFADSPDSILVFSDFGLKLTIWSLATGRGVEIKDPKPGETSYDLRPDTGHLALLTRNSAQDILMIFSPSSHKLLKSVDLGTIDAQEVQWSLDGRWLAIRDTSFAGHRVQIYTADGQHFRTFSGVGDPDEIGLGIKSMSWSTSGSLILGDYNSTITLLNKTTVSIDCMMIGAS